MTASLSSISPVPFSSCTSEGVPAQADRTGNPSERTALMVKPRIKAETMSHPAWDSAFFTRFISRVHDVCVVGMQRLWAYYAQVRPDGNPKLHCQCRRWMRIDGSCLQRIFVYMRIFH